MPFTLQVSRQGFFPECVISTLSANAKSTMHFLVRSRACLVHVWRENSEMASAAAAFFYFIVKLLAHTGMQSCLVTEKKILERPLRSQCLGGRSVLNNFAKFVPVCAVRVEPLADTNTSTCACSKSFSTSEVKSWQGMTRDDKSNYKSSWLRHAQITALHTPTVSLTTTQIDLVKPRQHRPAKVFRDVNAVSVSSGRGTIISIETLSETGTLPVV